MFDRRTAARREWSVWWRYAATLVAFELTGIILCSILNPSPLLPGVKLGYAAFNGLLQLVILGIATAFLVRYRIRTFHIWLGAAAVGLPLLVASVLPYNYWFPCYLLSTVLSIVLSIVWVIVIARVSFRVADPRLGYLCKTCFYDLRGLQSQVCSECGTPINPENTQPA